MSFTWSSVATGDKVLATQANEVRTNANTLITLMTANTAKCSSYSCSSLTSLPGTVSAGTSTVATSWLDDMKVAIDRIDSSKYCAQARYSYQSSQCSSYHGTRYASRHTNVYHYHNTSEREYYCTSAKSTYKAPNYHDDWADVSCYRD